MEAFSPADEQLLLGLAHLLERRQPIVLGAIADRAHHYGAVSDLVEPEDLGELHRIESLHRTRIDMTQRRSAQQKPKRDVTLPRRPLARPFAVRTGHQIADDHVAIL